MRYLLPLLVACGAGQHPRPTAGSIAGLARDHDSGQPIAKAEIRIRLQGEMSPHATTTAADGKYAVARLAPGRYSLSASFAGQPIDVDNIDVRAGDVASVDLMFTLGRPDAVHVNFGDPKEGAIDRYRPAGLTPSRAIVEGTVNDIGTHERVGGSVVTVYSKADGATLQAISADDGRYSIEVGPGTYEVSAYYSIGGRGQIEVRRTDIHIDGGEAVIVPLWIEIAKQ